MKYLTMYHQQNVNDTNTLKSNISILSTPSTNTLIEHSIGKDHQLPPPRQINSQNVAFVNNQL